jgi:hypothetical protein
VRHVVIDCKGYSALVRAQIRVEMSYRFDVGRLETEARVRLNQPVKNLRVEEDSQRRVYLVSFPLRKDEDLSQVLAVFRAIDNEVGEARRQEHLLSLLAEPEPEMDF